MPRSRATSTRASAAPAAHDDAALLRLALTDDHLGKLGLARTGEAGEADPLAGAHAIESAIHNTRDRNRVDVENDGTVVMLAELGARSAAGAAAGRIRHCVGVADHGRDEVVVAEVGGRLLP
jgi:hypothetical protein